MQIVRALALSIILIAGATATFGGARVDLRPVPAMPAVGYAPNSVVRVDLYVVDTGNPQGDILFRGLFFDFADTSDSVTFPGADGIAGTSDDGQITWRIPNFAGPCGCIVPNVSWVYPLPVPNPALQYVLPNDGEVSPLYFFVKLGADDVVIDVLNADESNPNLGAMATFGFGGPDPITMWRAFTGELSGGRLELFVNDGDVRGIESSNPENEAIDAREPTDISGQMVFGWNVVDVTFNGSVSGVAIEDFYVTHVGDDGSPPSIVNVVMLDSDTARLTLDQPIVPGTWTNILHVASGTNVRLGYLPGDVNRDGHTSPDDILDLIDSLNGVVSRPLWGTDANRSGVAEPSDILRLIDLLNGAGEFDVWNGRALP